MTQNDMISCLLFHVSKVIYCKLNGQVQGGDFHLRTAFNPMGIWGLFPSGWCMKLITCL